MGLRCPQEGSEVRGGPTARSRVNRPPTDAGLAGRQRIYPARNGQAAGERWWPSDARSGAGGSHLVITCVVCQTPIRTWRGDIRVESRCGAEYHARSGQLVKEPICELLSAEARA